MSDTYRRVGAPATVGDAAGTRTFNYRSDLQLDNEALGSFFNSKTVTANYDSYGRPTGYSFNGAATVSATLGYDGSTGRPNSVAGALGGTSTTFSLGYASGADWVSSVTNGSYSRSTPLVSRNDVISSATTSWGGTTEGQFTATYTDARGWRDGQNIATASYTTALGICRSTWGKALTAPRPPGERRAVAGARELEERMLATGPRRRARQGGGGRRWQGGRRRG